MPSIATLGAFAFDGTSGASIVGEIKIGGTPRTIVVSSNALSTKPVQVNAFTSGYRKIVLPVKLAGIDSQGETAKDHLHRMIVNLRTEVAKDTNTLTIELYGIGTPWSYDVYKNEPFDITLDALTQSRSVMKFDLTLNCL